MTQEEAKQTSGLSTPKKIGRPKKEDGAPIIPRQISYIVIGVMNDSSDNSSSDDQKLLHEEFHSPAGISEEELKKYSPEYVSSLFVSRGWKIEKIYGPKHDVKGLFKQNKVQSVVPSDNDELGANLGKGEFDGWHGTVFEIKNRTDVYCFAFVKNVGKNNTRKPGQLEKVPVNAIKLIKS